MKMPYLVLTVASSAVLLTGCENPDGSQNNTASGALIGGGFGALTGAAIGGNRHGGEDALLGAAAGAIAGGLIGNAADQQRDAQIRSQPPQSYTTTTTTTTTTIQAQPMSLADVKALARSGAGEDLIISQINTTHSIYHLSAGDIIDLRNNGVSDRVVTYMINSPNTVTAASPATTTVTIQSAPPPPLVDTYVVAPGPDYIWVGGEWSWGGSRWVWVGGHWMYPPRPHSVWVGGYRWHDGHGWHYDRGHWR